MVFKNYPNLSNQDSEYIFILRYYIFIEGQVYDDDFGLGGREGEGFGCQISIAPSDIVEPLTSTLYKRYLGRDRVWC